VRHFSFCQQLRALRHVRQRLVRNAGLRLLSTLPTHAASAALTPFPVTTASPHPVTLGTAKQAAAATVATRPTTSATATSASDVRWVRRRGGVWHVP